MIDRNTPRAEPNDHSGSDETQLYAGPTQRVELACHDLRPVREIPQHELQDGGSIRFVSCDSPQRRERQHKEGKEREERVEGDRGDERQIVASDEAYPTAPRRQPAPLDPPERLFAGTPCGLKPGSLGLGGGRLVHGVTLTPA